jgi:hypothetical protein
MLTRLSISPVLVALEHQERRDCRSITGPRVMIRTTGMKPNDAGIPHFVPHFVRFARLY